MHRTPGKILRKTPIEVEREGRIFALLNPVLKPSNIVSLGVYKEYLCYDFRGKRENLDRFFFLICTVTSANRRMHYCGFLAERDIIMIEEVLPGYALIGHLNIHRDSDSIRVFFRTNLKLWWKFKEEAEGECVEIKNVIVSFIRRNNCEYYYTSTIMNSY